MKSGINWIKIAYIFGVVALIVGIIDPLEGSVVISLGSILLAFSTYMKDDPHRRVFLVSSAMIIFGVTFLFYLSSLGGFGGKSSTSWWWGLLILPYPAGWLLAIVTLIIRAVRKQ
ncbi:MAG TPA: hypothetical protein VK207_02020 [Bacteroidales bacterium]|jgi:hypothetical protein|nr:hypothetical protein [Bacteroidales bacterium]